MNYESHAIRILGCAALMAGVAAGAISHAADPAGATAKLDRLIEVSGIAYSVRQLPGNIAAGFDDQELSKDMQGALHEAAILAFRPEPIIAKVRTTMAAALSGRQLDETLVWFDSPLGRRITDLENAAFGAEANDRILAYAKKLKERPAARHRTDLVTKIATATRSDELNAMIVETTYLATALGINAAQAPDDRLSVDTLRRRVKTVAADLRKQSDQSLMLTMLYSYETLSDKELESYLKFLTSRAGAAYSKSSAAGMREVLLEQMGHFTQAIPKAISNQKDRVST
jgi:hypothetical protein